MKLTKSQRLFIKAGEALAEEKLYKWYHESDEDYSKEISKAKRKRKKLIREALWAYEEELIRAFYDGVSSVRKEPDERPIIIEEDGQSIIF